MQIQREKAWEIWSHAVTSGRQRVDKQGAVPDIVSCWTNPGIVNNGIDATLLMLWPPALGLIVQERKSFRTSSSTASCVSILCLTDVTACDRISQAFLLHICILQVNKYWRWEWSGKPPSASLVCLCNVVPQQELSASYRPGIYGQLSGIKTGVICVALFFTLCKFCCVSWFIRYNPLCSSPSITQSQRRNHFSLKLPWPQVSCGMFVLCMSFTNKTYGFLCLRIASSHCLLPWLSK